jgi:electron transfer flavoprotein beta subunit
LALGADRGIQVETEGSVEPLVVAKLLKGVVDKEQPQLVILGKQSIDGDNNQTGQMLGALANMPQGTFASEIKVEGDKLSVTREVDAGMQTISLNLPAIVTTDLRLNEPRYASLPNIMKAKKKQLDVYSPADLGVEVKTHLTQLRVEPPPERSAGIIVENVEQLVDKLKNEAKVI